MKAVWKPLTIFAKASILDTWNGSERASKAKLITQTNLKPFDYINNAAGFLSFIDIVL